MGGLFIFGMKKKVEQSLVTVTERELEQMKAIVKKEKAVYHTLIMIGAQLSEVKNKEVKEMEIGDHVIVQPEGIKGYVTCECHHRICVQDKPIGFNRDRYFCHQRDNVSLLDEDFLING